MKIIYSDKHDLKDGIVDKLALFEFGDDSKDEVLFYGYESTVNDDLKRIYKNYKRRILLDLWSPTQFCGQDTEGKSIDEQYSGFDEIYSICPFTVKMRREELLDFRFKYIYHPFKKVEILDYSKDYDCVYFGGFPGKEHIQICEVFQNFDHRIVSMERNKFVTDYHVPFQEKFNIAAKCKISVIYNMLCLQDQHVENVKKNYKWNKNRAFSRLGDFRIPQYKARMSESAYCRCLMIVLDDHWNIAKDHWTQGEHYISCNIQNLESTIRQVLNNYDDYQNMIENAYQRSLEMDEMSVVRMIERGEQCYSKIS